MESLFFKILSIVLIAFGEGLAIYAEINSAKVNSGTSSFRSTFLQALIIIIIAGGFLVAGYMIGYKAFRNIWIVSIISIALIFVIEPILAYLIFNQLPTRGATIGLILGILGFFTTIFYKALD